MFWDDPEIQIHQKLVKGEWLNYPDLLRCQYDLKRGFRLSVVDLCTQTGGFLEKLYPYLSIYFQEKIKINRVFKKMFVSAPLQMYGELSDSKLQCFMKRLGQTLGQLHSQKMVLDIYDIHKKKCTRYDPV